MAHKLPFVLVVAGALVVTVGCGSSTPTSPLVSGTGPQLVITLSVNPASVPSATTMTVTAAGCSPTDGSYRWTATGGTAANLATVSLVPSLIFIAGQTAGTYSVTVSGSGCVTGTLAYVIPTPAPTVFTYTMVGMPDGTDVEVSSVPQVGQTVHCGGLSSNGQMMCAQTLTLGPTYLVTVSNAFTAQNDCKGVTASNGTLTIGVGATGCPATFVR